MRLVASIDVAATPDVVWDQVSDPSRYLDFMSGITRWEVVSDEPRGMGARYRMSMRVGSAEIGSLVEVIEWVEGRDMAWTSVTGLDQRGRWRLRERPGGRTHVEFRLAYGVAGAGFWGWISERVGAPTVRGHLQRTVRHLKRQVEHEQTRRRAAARRETGIAAS